MPLFIFSLIWCLYVSSSSKCIPKCFWVDICWKVESLNRRGGWYTFFIFCEKKNFLSLFWCIWIEEHFPLLTQRSTLSNLYLSSVKSFTLESRLSDKSFIYIKKYNGPRSKPWRRIAMIVSHSDSRPFRTTLCCLSYKKNSIKVRRSPESSIISKPFMSPSIKSFRYI